MPYKWIFHDNDDDSLYNLCEASLQRSQAPVHKKARAMDIEGYRSLQTIALQDIVLSWTKLTQADDINWFHQVFETKM